MDHTKWSDVQDYLATLIGGAVSQVTVKVSMPPVDELLTAGVRVIIPCDDQDSHSQRYALSDLSAKDEQWDQDVLIFGTVLTSDGKDARARVDALVDPVLGAIRSDPKLGGLVMLSEVTRVRREEAAPDRAVRQHSATIKVHVSAWVGQPAGG